MTVALITTVIVLTVALAILSAVQLTGRSQRTKRSPAGGARRILFPFTAGALSTRALDAALRLAGAEQATLVPVFLARVSLHLPLETPVPRQCSVAISLHEVIEQRASAFGVAVDSRIERGRTYRHALRQSIGDERYDRIVIAAAAHGTPGLHPDDVAWLLDTAPGEIVVLRPDQDEQLVPPRPRQRRRMRPAERTRRPAVLPRTLTPREGEA